MLKLPTPSWARPRASPSLPARSEAAAAYDVAKLKAASDHGVDAEGLKLNRPAAVYQAHPLFQYVRSYAAADAG